MQNPKTQSSKPRSDNPDNSPMQVVNVEVLLAAIESEYNEAVSEKEINEKNSLDKYVKQMSDGKDEEAKFILFQYFNSTIRIFQDLKSKIPNQKSKNENSKSKQLSQLIQSEVDNLKKIQKELNAEVSDVVKSKIDNMPEKIEENIGKSFSVSRKLYAKLESRKKIGTKLLESEIMEFRGDVLEEEEKLEVYKNKLQEKNPEREKSKNEISFELLILKTKELLEKSVDESPEKFKKVEESLSIVNAGFAKIKKEIENRKGKDSKLKDEDKLEIKRMLEENNEAFQSAYNDFAESCISLDINVGCLDKNNEPIYFQDMDSDSKISINPEGDLTPKQNLKVFELARSFNYATGYGYNILKSIDKVSHMTAKEQRENSKGISDRIRIIDKQISEDVDKLSVGKKLTADQKEGHKVSLDVEIVNLKEAQNELDILEDIEENQPTRNLVESILIRAKNRIQELTDKLEKVRLATEKEVMEKLDAAEKEIEKIEEGIREVNRKDAEGKNQLKDNIDKNGGIINKWWVFRKGYKNGQTYHNQRNVSDTMTDPKIYVKEAKDWIADMPESNEKEIKTKTKLLKKARRMNRRITSAKWRHYMTLDANEKGWYLGDKVGTAIVGKIGDG